MPREWMALLGDVIFVVTIGTGGYIMASVMYANAARQLRKLVSGHALQQNAERNEPEIAIDHACPGFVLQGETRDRAGSAFRFVLSQDIKRAPRGQA